MFVDIYVRCICMCARILVKSFWLNWENDFCTKTEVLLSVLLVFIYFVDIVIVVVLRYFPLCGSRLMYACRRRLSIIVAHHSFRIHPLPADQLKHKRISCFHSAVAAFISISIRYYFSLRTYFV